MSMWDYLETEQARGDLRRGAAAGDRLSAIADILDTAGEFLEGLGNGAELERAADEEEAGVHVPKRRRCGGHQERDGPAGPAEAGEWRDPGAPQHVLKAQSLLRRVVPYTTGEVLATILAAQNHLAEWNAGLWGTPVHLVEDEDSPWKTMTRRRSQSARFQHHRSQKPSEQTPRQSGIRGAAMGAQRPGTWMDTAAGRKY